MAGLHVPVIPFVDVLGNAGTVPPAQMVMVVPKLNIGLTIGLTVTVSEPVKAQEPATGVKLYIPEFSGSTTDGDHVPVIPLEEIAGNAGTLPPEQIVSVFPKLNVGATFGDTVTVNITGVAQTPAFGVNG